MLEEHCVTRVLEVCSFLQNKKKTWNLAICFKNHFPQLSFKRCALVYYTLSLKRNAPWKVAYLFRKIVDRWILKCFSNSRDQIWPGRGHLQSNQYFLWWNWNWNWIEHHWPGIGIELHIIGHLTLTLGCRGTQGIHGAFLLRLSVHAHPQYTFLL